MNLASKEQKAEILSQALPYLRQFFNKTIVIKYGGNAMIDQSLQADFASDVVLLKLVGMHPVVVHGGGPKINQLLDRLGKKSQFVQGLRVTDHETMEVVEMVLGQINKDLVSLINTSGGKAVGLTGQDANFIQAEKLIIDGENGAVAIDLGQVGKISNINVDLINFLETGGFIPVIAPIGVSKDNQTLNINADSVAGGLAEKLKAEKFILMSNIPGVMDNQRNLLPELKISQIQTLIEDGTISAGMLPKIESAMRAVKGGVKTAHIIDGRETHSLLLEILTNEGVGTLITAT